MKRGTILRNLWAWHETYFVYMGFPVRSGKMEAKKVGGYGLACVDGKWYFERAVYYSKDLKDTEHFPAVGEIDLARVCIDAILAAINRPKEG